MIFHSVNFFLKYCTLQSQTHTPITDRFGLLGKRQVRGGTKCKAVCRCTLGCLHTQPAHSMHVKPRTGMGSSDGLGNVAVEWSLVLRQIVL